MSRLRLSPRALAILLVLGLLPWAVLPAAATVTPDPATKTVLVGVDTTVGVGAWGLHFTGDGEPGAEACYRLDDLSYLTPASCYARAGEAGAMASTYSGAVVGNARGGLGFSYRLQANCVGQTMRNDLGFALAYARTALVFNDSGLVREARANVTFDPVTGGEEPRSLGPDARSHVLESWKAHGWLPWAETTKRVDLPASAFAFGRTYSLLLYARAHASVVGPHAEANPQASARIAPRAVTFDWTDGVAPWGVVSYAEGGVRVGDRTWFPQAGANVRVAADDDFSCPRRIHHRDSVLTPGGPFQRTDVDAQKTPVAFGGAEGRHDLEWSVEDWQGNVNPFQTTRYGVDLTAPGLAAAITPASPNAAGWYGVAAPVVEVTCTDAGSGCRHVEWTDAARPVPVRVPGGRASVALAEGAPNVFACSAADHVGRVQAACGVTAYVDLTAPALKATCGGVDCADPVGWYASAQTVAVVCTDALSGGVEARWRLDGGGWTPYAGPFVVSPEGMHALELECDDLADNVARRGYGIGVDPVAPGATTATVPAHVNADPVWTLAATDLVSGVKDFEARVDGGASRVTNATPSLAGASEGVHCLDARARDHAHNVGPWTTGACTLVDRTAPVTALTRPVAGALYLGDSFAGRLWDPARGAYATSDVALGPLTLRATAADPHAANGAAPSGLAQWSLSLPFSEKPPVPCDLAAAECAWTVAPYFQQTTRILTYASGATDRAGNAAVATRDVDHVGVLAVASPWSTKGPHVEIRWQAGSPGTTYVVHRSPTPDCDGTSPIVPMTNASATSVNDRVVTPGATYWYCVDYVGGSPGGISIAYPARVADAVSSQDHPTVIDRWDADRIYEVRAS